MIVADTNLVVPLLLEHEKSQQALALCTRDPDWHLPDWWRIELSNVLREKIKAGEISKKKVDNMVKAKAEHAGILREVEVLQTVPWLTAVQRGRLANLHATAGTGLELLTVVAP
ncbi:MAG: type II toxin-antitoxin system VapC family toxin [Luteolibacter sp.]